MTKVERFLRSLDTFIQKVETNDAFLQALAAEFPEFSNLANTIDEFETEIARLLRNERNHFMDALSGFAGSPLESVLVNFTTVQFIEDNFAVDMKTINQRFFDETIREITSTVMDGIDRDVAFNTVSRRTTDWIEGWSEELGEIMQLNTHEKVEKILREGIERGASIQDIELELAELPQFNRARARTTAITEVLTASSQSHYEAYKQSPAVIGKRWKHSGSAGIEPRPNHVAMTGTVVAVDEPFTIIDSIETAMYPRDPNLTARERVNCHCVMVLLLMMTF
ncbi:phage minor head protein [Geomicrobium sp. JCM 19039]|uniref:phage minor head protein n=1 Tax=Geomicrobium sp. JCM 19039 TaxID=1460636 RepID=UPI00045F2935|nr:phage minor head protein [Geomicrobium sp. JCM 19039]GAK11387.1 phage minor capsid protein [Geomicrobium sp. JCM 19039]